MYVRIVNHCRYILPYHVVYIYMMYCTNVHTHSYFERLSGKQTEQWNEWKEISHGKFQHPKNVQISISHGRSHHIISPSSKRLSARFTCRSTKTFVAMSHGPRVASDKRASCCRLPSSPSGTLRMRAHSISSSWATLSLICLCTKWVHLFLEKDDNQHLIRVVLVVDFSLEWNSIPKFDRFTF